MKTFFIVYLIGFIIAGFAALLSFQNNKFYKFHRVFIMALMKQKNIENIDINAATDNIISGHVRSIMFLSYFGIVKLIMFWVIYAKYSKSFQK